MPLRGEAFTRADELLGRELRAIKPESLRLMLTRRCRHARDAFEASRDARAVAYTLLCGHRMALLHFAATAPPRFYQPPRHASPASHFSIMPASSRRIAVGDGFFISRDALCLPGSHVAIVTATLLTFGASAIASI